MKDFEILVDTTSDADEGILNKYGIRLIPAHYSVDGKEYTSYPSWDGETREDFYRSLKQSPERFTTAPPSIGETAKVFEEIVSNGKGVIYLTMSSGLSGTNSFAAEAKEIVSKQYPDAEIECFDTLRFGPAVCLMAVNAAVMRNSGASFPETVKMLYSERNTYHQAGWLDDLTFVAKKGRITHSKAFLGTLIGVKPIGEFDKNGMTTVLGKAKGEKAAYSCLINYIKETAVAPENQIFFVATTNRIKQAAVFAEMIKEAFHPKAVEIKDVYRSNGINVGPGLMAAYYTGKPITEDLAFEKNIIRESSEGK